MDYRKFKDTYYVRVDKGEEIIASILEVCQKENIASAIFSGIGGCSRVENQIFIPETGTFETELVEGMLELISLNGDVITDDEGNYYHHTHAMLSYKKGGAHCFAGGHMKSLEVLYIAEIELRPVIGGEIKRKFDPETGTGFWDFR